MFIKILNLSEFPIASFLMETTKGIPKENEKYKFNIFCVYYYSCGYHQELFQLNIEFSFGFKHIKTGYTYGMF